MLQFQSAVPGHSRYLATALMFALVTGGVLGNTSLQAHAESSARHKNSPQENSLALQLSESLNFQTAVPGKPFEGILVQDYHRGKQSIPAGSKFSGTIRSVEAAGADAPQPEGLTLAIERVTFPTGEELVLEQGNEETVTQRSRKDIFLKDGTPMAATTAAVSIPLQLATSLSPLATIPISMGARSVVGTLHARSQQPVGHKNWWKAFKSGVSRGSGYHFSKALIANPEKQPEIGAGENVELRLSQDVLDAVLNKASSLEKAEQQAVSVPQNNPNEQEGTVGTVDSVNTTPITLLLQADFPTEDVQDSLSPSSFQSTVDGLSLDDLSSEVSNTSDSLTGVESLQQ